MQRSGRAAKNRPNHQPPPKRQDGDTAETHEGFVVAFAVSPEKLKEQISEFMPQLASNPGKMRTFLGEIVQAGSTEGAAIRHFRWSARLFLIAVLLHFISLLIPVLQQHLPV